MIGSLRRTIEVREKELQDLIKDLHDDHAKVTPALALAPTPSPPSPSPPPHPHPRPRPHSLPNPTPKALEAIKKEHKEEQKQLKDGYVNAIASLGDTIEEMKVGS